MRTMSRIHSLMSRILIFHGVQNEKLFEIAGFLCNTNTVNYVYLKYRYINPMNISRISSGKLNFIREKSPWNIEKDQRCW